MIHQFIFSICNGCLDKKFPETYNFCVSNWRGTLGPPGYAMGTLTIWYIPDDERRTFPGNKSCCPFSDDFVIKIY